MPHGLRTSYKLLLNIQIHVEYKETDETTEKRANYYS